MHGIETDRRRKEEIRGKGERGREGKVEEFFMSIIAVGVLW